MLNCTVQSTVPNTDTASTVVSKAGYFGRPWQSTTGETVFRDTIVEPSYGAEGSLVLPEGWLDSLSGRSALCGEYNTAEVLPGLNNLDKRAPWATKFASPAIADGTAMEPKAWLGGWDAFAGKDMSVETHTFADATPGTAKVQTGINVQDVKTITVDGEAYAWVRDLATALAGTGAKFNVTWDGGVALVPGETYVPSGADTTAALTGDVRYAAPSYATSVKGAVVNLDAVVFTDANQGGYTFYKLSDLADVLGFTVK